MMTIVRVTEQHIREGVPHDSDCCPVQLALKEHGMSLATHSMPDVARIWIKGYDRMGGQGDPFEFEMDTGWLSCPWSDVTEEKAQ